MLVATQYPTETGAVATLENSVRESRKHSILFIATQSFGFLIRQTTTLENSAISVKMVTLLLISLACLLFPLQAYRYQVWTMKAS